MNVKIYSAIMLINSYSQGLLVPVISLIFIDKGLSLSQVAIIFGIYAATVILLEFPTGVAADVIGRKKTFCASLIVTAIAFLFILIGQSLPILYLGIILYGAGRALSSGSFEALFIDQYTHSFGKDRLPKILTLQSVLDAVGLSLGALTGGLFPTIVNSMVPAIGTYELNLIIKVALTIITLFLSLTFIKEYNTMETPTTEKPKTISLKNHIVSSFSLVVKNSTLSFMFISLFSTGFFLSTLETYWQPHFISFMEDDSLLWMLGVLAFLYFAFAMIGNIVCEKLTTKAQANCKRIYVIFRILISSSLILLALQVHIIPFTIVYSLVYFFFGAANIAEGVVINREIPNDRRASVLSINSLICQGGTLLASVLSSIFLRYISIPTLWSISAVLILLSALMVSKSAKAQVEVPVV